LAPFLGTLLLTVAACGGGAAPGRTQPSTSATDAINSFMRAVRDSNLTKMATMWGSSKGSAATTGQPTDYSRRVVLIQSYLRHDDYRIAADAEERRGQRGMQVELRRQACTWSVPFTVVQSENEGWIISNIDLTRAGNPAKSCDPRAPRDSTPNP
jgi:hypothetical protein